MFGKNKNKNTTRQPQVNLDSVNNSFSAEENENIQVAINPEVTDTVTDIPEAPVIPETSESYIPEVPTSVTTEPVNVTNEYVSEVPVSDDVLEVLENTEVPASNIEVVEDISALETLNEETMLETPSASDESIVTEANEIAKSESAVIYSSFDDVDPDILLDVPSAEISSRKEEKKKISDSFVPNPVEPVKLNLDKNEEAVTEPKSSKKTFLYVLVSVLIVIAIVGFFAYSKTGIKSKFESPLSINNHLVSSDEFSFMYHYILIENGVDVFAKDSQEMLNSPSEDINYKSNRDYFLDITAKELQTTQLLYDDATKNGYKIEEKHYSMARAYVDWLNSKADELNISLDTYIKGVFGSQVDEQCVINTLAKKYFTEDYASDAKLVELQATSEQAAEAYNNNKNAYDLVSYKILRITYEQREEAFIATANLHANEIISNMNGNPDNFEQAASDFFSGDAQEQLMKPDSALVSNARYTDISHEEFRDWLFDESRVSGDTVIFADEDGFPIILCFVERKPQETPLRNVKIIEVTARPGEEGDSFSMGDAQALAQSIYDYITDETKLQSVENYYTDEVLDGTIYTTASSDTYPGKFSDTLDTWIFDPNRKSGDKEILETETGFYVVYFISESTMPEWYDRVNSFIRMNNYQAFLNELMTEYDYKFNQAGLEQIHDVP